MPHSVQLPIMRAVLCLCIFPRSVIGVAGRLRLSVKEANKQDGEHQTLLTARWLSFSLLLKTCEGPNVHLSRLYV